MTRKTDSPPLLFVPGSLSGGWVWEENFVPFFEKQGYSVHTFAFSSHTARFPQRWKLRVSDYIDELVAKIGGFSKPPLIIAHSFGGFISLQAARQAPVAGLALLSAVPEHGLLKSGLHLGRMSPVSLLKLLMVITDSRVTRYGTPPIGIYSDTCQPDLVEAFTSRLRPESVPALMSTLLSLPKERTPPLNFPVHFYGAEGDHIIPAKEVRRAANRYNAPLTIYPGMSHMFQAEREWQRVAVDVHQWFKTITETRGHLEADGRHITTNSNSVNS